MSNNEIRQDSHEKRLLDLAKLNIHEENSFGMTIDEYNELKEILNDVKPNHPSNKFPDFISENSFVEIFAVSSAKETKRKGSPYLKDKTRIEQANKVSIKNEESFHRDLWYGKHDYSYLTRSFEKNFNKHLSSLSKMKSELSTDIRRTGIFFVEYQEAYALSMLLKMSHENKNGFLSGDYQDYQGIMDNYRLTRDNAMLEWLKKYKSEIQYVIFFNEQNIEYIKLSGIDSLTSSFAQQTVVASNYTVRTFSRYKIELDFDGK